MQIKLITLIICASLVAIGFASPSPQGDELDSITTSDEQIPPGFEIDDLGVPGGIDDPILGSLNNELKEALVRRRLWEGIHRIIRFRDCDRGRGHGRIGQKIRKVLRELKKKEWTPRSA